MVVRSGGGVFNLQFRVTSESLVSAYKWEVEGVFNLQFRVTSESLVSAYKSASFFSKLLNLYLLQYMLVNQYSQCKGPRDKRHDLKWQRDKVGPPVRIVKRTKGGREVIPQ